MAAVPDYSINYNDPRFTQVTNEKNAALNNINNTYNTMINDSEKYYQNQIDNIANYEKTQTDLQNQKTEQAITEINQNKDKTTRDYENEQKAAYTDYQKQTDKYGVNAERMAQNGLQNTGYSESSQVSMYNAYQQRYSVARQSYNDAIQNYDNQITNARLQNSSALAEIAYNSLQQQLELSLQGFQYKNQLLQTQLEAQRQTDQDYYQRWQNVLGQINTENALREQVRQYNEDLAEKQRQYNETMAFNKAQAEQEQTNWEKQFALAQAGSSGGSGGGSRTPSNYTTPTQTTTTSYDNPFAGGGSSTSVFTKIANAAKKVISNAASNAKMTATYTPSLSSGAANSWYKKNIGTAKLTKEELAKKIASAGNTLSAKDRQSIYKAYGLS